MTLYCDPQPTGEEFAYRCARCGTVYRGVKKLPLHAQCGPAPAPTPRAWALGPARPGVGQILHRLLAQIGLLAGRECNCGDFAAKMDTWGIDGCRGVHREEILAHLREAARAVPLAQRAKAFAAAATQGLWVSPLRPGESLLDEALRRADRLLPRVFVVGHEPDRMAKVEARPHLRKVFLPDVRPSLRLTLPPNKLAENQIYTSDLLLTDAEYIGVAAASWNEKYLGGVWKTVSTPHCLPLERLDELPLAPHIVWAAHRFSERVFLGGLDCFLPGLMPLVSEALAHLGKQLPANGATTLLASNFVAHRDVTLDLRAWQRRAIAFLDRRHGAEWPLCDRENDPAVTCRLPAYVGEALSICYFASRPDLEIRQIPPP